MNYHARFQQLAELFPGDAEPDWLSEMAEAEQREREAWLCPICEEDVRHSCRCPENPENEK